MNLRYYSNFKSVKEKTYRIEIDTVMSTFSEPLTLSPDPISVEYESGALYQPLKLSSATISVLTDNVLSDLYTAENQGVSIRLFNQTDNILEWSGYLTPNLYSSEFVSSFDSVELEAIDTLSSLENIKYSYIGDSGTFRSFTDILFFVLDKADPKRVLNKVYIQKTNRMVKESLACLFEDSYIHERNFFDEDNEPSTCREILESLVQYYGMTVIQWMDSYYIIDYDFINRGSSDFFVYDRSTHTCVDVIIENARHNVSDIGVSESAGNISLGDVYNKVSVVANMNVISVLCPELLDDDDLINQNADENKYYETKKVVNGEEYTFLNAYFKSKKNWNYLTPFSVKVVSDVSRPPVMLERTYINEITADNQDVYAGTLWQKCCKYKSNEEPSKLSWDTYLTFVKNDHAYDSNYVVDDCFLKLNKETLSVNILKGGYIIVNINYLLSEDSRFNPNNDGHDVNFKGDYNTLFPAKLRIGNMYFDGDKFVDNTIYARRSAKGCYHTVYFESVYVGKLPIYKIKDSDGDWFYVDVNQFNAHNGEKIESQTPDENDRWFYRDKDKQKILIDESFYHECILRDGFYLVTKNRDNDPVYSDKKLTNTVSWRMNISDSSDGVAIPLPSFVMAGKIEFELSHPNCLDRMMPTYPSQGVNRGYAHSVHISDFSLKYSNKKTNFDIFDSKSDDTDIVYSNVINDNNITEMEDISLFINSRAKDIASYSNSATKIDGKFDYIKDIYSPFNDARFVPEQILIDKLYRHYSSPKFKYQNCLNRGFGILSRIKENSLKKTMVVDCMNINYASENCIVTLIEV